MRHKFVGGSYIQSTPDIDEVARLMAARGITGIGPEAVVKRVVRYKASDSRVDSMGDVILEDSWDLTEWLANPQFLLNHNSRSLDSVMGRGLDAKITPNGLFCDVFFFPPDMATSEQTEAVFKLVKAGVFPDCSVGFQPKQKGYRWPTPDDEKTYPGIDGLVFTSVLLKELSTVTIGANVGAKVEATAKMYNQFSEGELKALQNDENTAALIDLASFRLKGPTPQVQMPGMETLALTISDLTKQVGAMNATNEKLREELARKNQDVLTTDEIGEVIVKLGEVADILAKNLPPDGTPAPEKPVTDEVQRNLSAALESLTLAVNNHK